MYNPPPPWNKRPLPLGGPELNKRPGAYSIIYGILILLFLHMFYLLILLNQSIYFICDFHCAVKFSIRHKPALTLL